MSLDELRKVLETGLAIDHRKLLGNSIEGEVIR